MTPVLSSSNKPNTLKNHKQTITERLSLDLQTFKISSCESRFIILGVTISKKSSKVTRAASSLSMSWSKARSSLFFTWKLHKRGKHGLSEEKRNVQNPRARKHAFNSLISMVPVQSKETALKNWKTVSSKKPEFSVSNRLNASLISSMASSSRPVLDQEGTYRQRTTRNKGEIDTYRRQALFFLSFKLKPSVDSWTV